MTTSDRFPRATEPASSVRPVGLTSDPAAVVEDVPATGRISGVLLAEPGKRARWPFPHPRLVRRLTAAALALVVMATGWSVGGALAAPGTDTVAARIAEWARDHDMGGLVTWLEQQQYRREQPTVGGAPAGGIPPAAGALPAPADPPSAPAAASADPPAAGAEVDEPPAPPQLPPVASVAPLPGEGRWQTVVTAHGKPAVRVATLRVDDQHTAYLAGVMWLDPALVRGELRPGTRDPGGTWQAATSLTPGEQKTVAAVFNAGFRLTNNASRGGYYSEGRTAVALVDGAASLVLRTDGTATVGSWNREVRMGPEVASVRQNLVMLVDRGQVNPTCASGGTEEWGSTIGQAAFIDRSAFGVTADGAEVYVSGAALSVCTLGRLLADAGVVRGMELDINPAWTSGAYFHDSATGPPQGFRLYPTQQVAPQHYLSPSSRDWYAWFLRP